MSSKPGVMQIEPAGQITVMPIGDRFGLKVFSGYGASAYVELSNADVDRLIEILAQHRKQANA